MRVIILAAGRGSRMKGLTDDRPKCLTRLADRPLLAWQLEALECAGLGPVTLVGGYRWERLAGWGPDVLRNDRWDVTNMVQSLCRARELLLAEPCLVAYADIVYRPEHVAALAAAPGELVVLYDTAFAGLWRARFGEAWLDDAETFRDQDGRLVEIGRKTADAAAIQGQYLGLLKFTPPAWQRVEALLGGLPAATADALDMTGLLARLLQERMTIHTVGVAGGWCEVDSAHDLAVYEAALARGDWSHDWRSER